MKLFFTIDQLPANSQSTLGRVVAASSDGISTRTLTDVYRFITEAAKEIKITMQQTRPASMLVRHLVLERVSKF